MNQSFDLINFTRIFYNENRKGNYLENRFKELLKASRAYAKKAGLTQADIKEAIRRVRSQSK